MTRAKIILHVMAIAGLGWNGGIGKGALVACKTTNMDDLYGRFWTELKAKEFEIWNSKVLSNRPRK